MVDDLHVAYLSAQVAGDEAAMLRVLRELTDRDDLGPLVPLIDHAFVLAARRWFGCCYTGAQVVQLVGHARALFEEQPDLIDPIAGEAEIRRALGENAPLAHNVDARGTIQLAVLDYLVRALDLTEEAVSELFERARIAANCLPPHGSTEAWQGHDGNG